MNQGKNQGLLAELKLLLRSVPSLTVTVFIVATISMNLLANKSINLPFSWLALDCGIIVSWIIFLCMDMITRRFRAQSGHDAQRGLHRCQSRDVSGLLSRQPDPGNLGRILCRRVRNSHKHRPEPHLRRNLVCASRKHRSPSSFPLS